MEELAKFYVSFELCLSRFGKYTAKISRKKLTELSVNSELCPMNIAQVYFEKILGKS